MTDITTEHIVEHDLLTITVSGDYTVSNNTNVVEQWIAELMEKKCTRCLIDYRDADFSAQTVATINRSEFYKTQNLSRVIKIAAVFREITDDARFVETALLNRGWNYKVYTSPDEALDWLKGT